MIKGAFQTSRVNDYGFASIKVSGTWYGTDKKGAKPDFEDGDIVEFEAFKNAKGFDTYKSATLRLVTAEADVKTEGAAVGTAPKTGKSDYAQKENYWADKAAADAAKEPKIAYFASLERGLAFVDLAIRVGAFKALEKAKDADKLAVLEAFVTETTQRFIDESYVSASTEAMQSAGADVEAAAGTLATDDAKWA